MKLINQSFEILEQKDFTITGIKKFIERCGRVCYKSEDRITDDSYEKFVNMLESRGHDRPLEFGTVHLKMILPDFEGFIHSLLTVGMLNNIWIKHAYKGDVIYITTNYRYYLDIIKYFPNVRKYLTEEDNEYYPKRYAVHFITSRGIMDEFRTHVGLSHLAESTRYCNYSKDKFNNELTFIRPCWLNIPTGQHVYWNGDWCDINKMKIQLPEGEHEDIDAFLWVLSNAEMQYTLLINNGWTPQQAREVLPLAVKSELISCGFEDAWKNFFYRRCAKDAHPMAREIANKLHEEFIKRQILKSK